MLSRFSEIENPKFIQSQGHQIWIPVKYVLVCQGNCFTKKCYSPVSQETVNNVTVLDMDILLLMKSPLPFSLKTL